MGNIKVLSLFGTRPEAIKMAPLVLALNACPEIESVLAVTGQHREMLDSVLELFGLTPDHDLNIMAPRQTLSDITSKTLLGLDPVLDAVKPDLVLVHGDTSTTMAGALSAFYHQMAVGHVEAGLRTYNKYAPFPEEINRRVVSAIAELHFAPTHSNEDNLHREGTEDGVFVTGNTVIDALATTVRPGYAFRDSTLQKVDFSEGRMILATAHRRENHGPGLTGIFSALRDLLERYPDLRVVLPVHLSPVVRECAQKILGDVPRALLTDPLPVDELHNLMARADIVLTDSGGLQEEAPALGKPVLVLRGETERPEAIAAGTVKLVGTDRTRIVEETARLLDDKAAYDAMANAVNPYGDGQASRRIVDAILYHFGKRETPPDRFGG